MAIGTSSGKYYENEFDHALGSMEDPSKTPQSRINQGFQGIEEAQEGIYEDPSKKSAMDKRYDTGDQFITQGVNRSFKSDFDDSGAPALGNIRRYQKEIQGLQNDIRDTKEKYGIQDKEKPAGPPEMKPEEIEQYEGIIGRRIAGDIPTPDSKPNGLQDTYSEQHRQSLLWQSPVVGSKGGEYNPLIGGTPESRRQEMHDMLDQTQDVHDQNFETMKKNWNDHAARDSRFAPIGPEHKPSNAHIIRGWKSIPAFEEYLKNLPDDVEAFDMKDGTVVFKKKPALTS